METDDSRGLIITLDQPSPEDMAMLEMVRGALEIMVAEAMAPYLERLQSLEDKIAALTEEDAHGLAED